MIQKLIIKGIVQGVGMRYHIATQARKHNLNGEVKNNTNGTVTCILSGDQSTIQQFINNLKNHHPGEIADIETEILADQTYKNFSIKH